MTADPDGFTPVTRDDVADDNPQVLAHHIRLLRSEMRDGFRSVVETFGDKILPALGRIEVMIDDLNLRVNQIERSQLDFKDRLRALERRAPLPEAKTVTRRKPARKQT